MPIIIKAGYLVKPPVALTVDAPKSNISEIQPFVNPGWR